MEIEKTDIMYKIREDVDLKELEKYGFEKVGEFYIKKYDFKQTFNYYQNFYIRIRNLSNYAYYKEIQDCAEDKLGFVHQNYENVGLEDKIQDLIKANLIVKVKE